MLRVTGAVCLGGSLALLLAMGMFGLDVLQMRELRVEEMQSSILAGGMFQEVKYFVAAFVLAFLGYGALSSAKTAGLAGGRKSGKSPGIVSSAG
ncbi:MAG: hypothetical protein O2958_03400 [Gemmatimonadetes bacterium]|nr:hypothetical protein [Gemmatimonadota bacterium]MDA1102366.1 hypothetical protein [Gemmatimonadota bacterium]